MKLLLQCAGLFSLTALFLANLHTATASPFNASDLQNSSMRLQARFENGPDGLPDGGRGPLILHDQWFRGPGGPWQYGDYEYYCGVFGTGSHEQLFKAISDLKSADARWSKCTVEAKSCDRVWCFKNTAVHVCNDNDYQIRINCWNAGYFASKLNALCCNPKGTPGFGGKAGQIFHPTDGYNVIVAHANCDTPPDTPPQGPVGGTGKHCLPTYPWYDRKNKEEDGE